MWLHSQIYPKQILYSNYFHPPVLTDIFLSLHETYHWDLLSFAVSLNYPPRKFALPCNNGLVQSRWNILQVSRNSRITTKGEIMWLLTQWIICSLLIRGGWCATLTWRTADAALPVSDRCSCGWIHVLIRVVLFSLWCLKHHIYLKHHALWMLLFELAVFQW